MLISVTMIANPHCIQCCCICFLFVCCFVCHGMNVEVREQLSGVTSLLRLCDWTQVVRRNGKALAFTHRAISSVRKGCLKCLSSSLLFHEMYYIYNPNFVNEWVRRCRKFKEVDLGFRACYQKRVFEHCRSGMGLYSFFIFLYRNAFWLIFISNWSSQWDKVKGIDKCIWEGVGGE